MPETKIPSRVALVACRSYDPAEVITAVARGIGLLGGFCTFADLADKLLLKPNLLAATAPERAVTTHPEIFRAVARLMQAEGFSPSFGDGPGVISLRNAGGMTGLRQVARELNVPEVSFSGSIIRHFKLGRQNKQFEIYRSLESFNRIISLPKFKTHDLTRITGAVKNQFGCLTFRQKREFHAVLQNKQHFSAMLLDLNRCIGPSLYIMDAIEAMEGNGPMNGTPYRLGLIAISNDALALDATLCRIVDLDPYLVDYLAIGERSGFGNVARESIEILGDPLENFIRKDFRVDRRKSFRANQRSILNFFYDRLSKVPVIDEDVCTRCGDCEKACPTDPESILFHDKILPPTVDYKTCIQCYCCAENCTHGAIKLRRKGLFFVKDIF